MCGLFHTQVCFPLSTLYLTKGSAGVCTQGTEYGVLAAFDSEVLLLVIVSSSLIDMLSLGSQASECMSSWIRVATSDSQAVVGQSTVMSRIGMKAPVMLYQKNVTTDFS